MSLLTILALASVVILTLFLIAFWPHEPKNKRDVRGGPRLS